MKARTQAPETGWLRKVSGGRKEEPRVKRAPRVGSENPGSGHLTNPAPVQPKVARRFRFWRAAGEVQENPAARTWRRRRRRLPTR